MFTKEDIETVKIIHHLVKGRGLTLKGAQQKLKDKGLPWEKAKAFDGSAVVGDFINKNDLKSADNILFKLTNNAVTVQEGESQHMLWNIDEIIAYVSQYFTLKIGDLIFTGTPQGVF